MTSYESQYYNRCQVSYSVYSKQDYVSSITCYVGGYRRLCMLLFPDLSYSGNEQPTSTAHAWTTIISMWPMSTSEDTDWSFSCRKKNKNQHTRTEATKRSKTHDMAEDPNLVQVSASWLKMVWCAKTLAGFQDRMQPPDKTELWSQQDCSLPSRQSCALLHTQCTLTVNNHTYIYKESTYINRILRIIIIFIIILGGVIQSLREHKTRAIPDTISITTHCRMSPQIWPGVCVYRQSGDKLQHVYFSCCPRKQRRKNPCQPIKSVPDPPGTTRTEGKITK